MKLGILRTASLVFILVLTLFSCTKKERGDPISNNADIKAFVNHFFIPGTSLTASESEKFLLSAQNAEDLVTADDICLPHGLCNRTKEYLLEFTPNFLFETVNGRIAVWEADPDSFVDLCDITKKKVFRVRGAGTEGTIYGTVWLSDYEFAVYGIESDEGFVDVFDIKAELRTSFTLDGTKKKANVDPAAFLIATYGGEERLKEPQKTTDR